jgi:hypothetical protein
MAGDDADPIPPKAMGCSMSRRSQIGVLIMALASFNGDVCWDD